MCGISKLYDHLSKRYKEGEYIIYKSSMSQNICNVPPYIAPLPPLQPIVHPGQYVACILHKALMMYCSFPMVINKTIYLEAVNLHTYHIHFTSNKTITS